MFNRSSKAIFAALAVLAFSSAAFAADAPAKSDVKDLARVEVTGSRLAEDIRELPASAYVITREDIESTNARDIHQLLEKIPGITPELRGRAMTHDRALTLRGLTAEILLLVDGVPFKNASGMTSYNTFDLRTIAMEEIERIEVVKGASSAIYGSSAAGGVINIITRKGEKKSSASTKVETGSNGWFKGAVRGTAVTENGISATVGYTRTRETGNTLISMYKDKKDKKWHGDYADDYTANEYNVRFDKGAWSLTGDWGDLKSRYTNKGGADGHDGDYKRIALNYNDGITVANVYYHNNFRDHGIKDKNSFENEAWGATFNRKQVFFGQNFVYGLDFRSETLVKKEWKKGPVITDIDRTRNGLAPYIETTVALGDVNMDLGLRYEHWDVDEAENVDEVLPKVSFSYETESGKLLYATAGRFFVIPNFTTLVSTSKGYEPNPNLKPEQGWTYDLGIKDTKAKNPWSLGLFYVEMDDKFQWNGSKELTGGSKPYYYINIAEYKGYGFEAQYTYNFNDVWSVTPGVSYLHAEERETAGSDWKRSQDPRWDLSAYINYKKGEWKGELGLHYYGDRELGKIDPVFADQDGDMFIADASIVWTPELMEGNIFRLSCTNLFDKEYISKYSTSGTYFVPERRIVLSWEHKF